MICMFSHGTEAFYCRQDTMSSLAKILLEKFIPTWELYSNSKVIKEPILLVRYFNKSVLFGWSYNIFTALTTLTSQV